MIISNTHYQPGTIPLNLYTRRLKLRGIKKKKKNGVRGNRTSKYQSQACSKDAKIQEVLRSANEIRWETVQQIPLSEMLGRALRRAGAQVGGKGFAFPSQERKVI